MQLPLALVFIVGFASGQLIGSNNEERPPVGPISILPYPFPNNNGGSNGNDRPNNLLSAFQNFFANAAANGANNGGQPIQVQISTIRPPTNLLTILSGFVNRPQQQQSTTTSTGTPTVTTQNPSSSSTVVPIVTAPTSTAASSSGTTPGATSSGTNNSTRAIFSTLPFNFSEAAGSISPQDLIAFYNQE